MTDMEDAFWDLMSFLLRCIFTAAIGLGVFILWNNVPTSQYMWFAFGAIHVMLATFLVMVWRYEG
jgi:uncharacterized membrane protein YjjB (DUF3815 family)